MKKFATIMMTTLALSGAQVAIADDATGIQLSRTVGYTELDLTQPKAVEILHRRLSNAAEQVCAPLKGREVWKLREHRQCVSEALSQAVVGVDRPLLTQYHQEKSGAAMPRVAAR